MPEIEQEDFLTPTPSTATGKIFDFTTTVEMMDDATKNVYYRLRRVAIMANNEQGDPERLPDGKIISEAEVIETLGPDYLTGLIVDRKCCG